MGEQTGECCKRLIAPVGQIIVVLLGQNPLQAQAATTPSAHVEPQASEILLWPFHFAVAEDDISKAAYGNQVATWQWEVDLCSEIAL